MIPEGCVGPTRRPLWLEPVLPRGIGRSSDRVRVTVQLRDGISGGQLWAERYGRTLTADNLFAVQDEIASRVVTKVAEPYEGAINRTLLTELSCRTHSVTTYDAVLRLNHYRQNVSYDAYVLARRGLEEALVDHAESTVTVVR